MTTTFMSAGYPSLSISAPPVRLSGEHDDRPKEAPETATTVRVADGQTLTTDGPFVAVKEALGGYLLFEADDLDVRRFWRGGEERRRGELA